MATEQAPVLHKVKKTKEDQDTLRSLSLLKSIDSRLEDVPGLAKKIGKPSRRPKYSSSPELKEIRKDFQQFETFVNRVIDKDSIPKQYLERYSRIQQSTYEKMTSSLQDSLDEYTDAILSKKTQLTKTDLKNLAKVQSIKDKFSKLAPKNEDSLADLKKSVSELVTPIREGVDVSGLSKKDREDYLANLNEQNKEQRESIKEQIDETRKSLLSKSELTESDKEQLRQLDNIQVALKEFGVEQRITTRETSKTGEYIKDSFGKGAGGLADSIASGILGPLNLVIAPLSEQFDLSVSSFMDKIFGGDKEFTKKGKKIKPRRSDVLKSNPEIVYAVDTMLKEDQKKLPEKTEEGDLISKLGGLASIGSLIASLVPFILPALGITAGVVAVGALINQLVKDTKKRQAEGEAIVSDIENSPEKKAELQKRGLSTPTKTQGAQLETKRALGSIATGKGYEADISNPEMIAGTGDVENIKVLSTVISDKAAYRKQLASVFGGDPTGKKGLYWMLGADGKYYVSKTEDMKDKYQWIFDTMGEKGKIFANGKTSDQKSPWWDYFYKSQDMDFNFDAMLKDNKGKSLKFHTGGTVPGSEDQEVPIVAKGKEHIYTKDQNDFLLKRLSRKENFDSKNISIDLSSINKQIEKALDISSVTDKLDMLISTIEKKPFNNVVSTQPASIDFDKLRTT